MGLFLLFMVPLGLYILSACKMVFVIIVFSWFSWLVGGFFLFWLLFIIPLGMYILSACKMVFVMNVVSWCILSAGVWFLSVVSIQLV